MKKGNNKKNKIITFEGSFHGRTLGTIAASGEKKLTRGFEPNLQGFDRVPIKNLDKIYELISERTAAILIEPIQGEGGIRCFEREYIKELRKICNENDSLLIFDEVQCGIGRTGTLFAYENFNVVPDIVAIAKGLGGVPNWGLLSYRGSLNRYGLRHSWFNIWWKPIGVRGSVRSAERDY